MPPGYDDTDFVDRDFQNAQRAGASAGGQRPPTREELENKVGETQERLAQLKRAQEALERERAALEEARRRRVELETGREEMIRHLTRGIGLLEENTLSAQRSAEQMSKTISDFREALAKVQSIHEQSWTEENYQVELTRALTAIENARMEWNGARIKFEVLNPVTPGLEAGGSHGGAGPGPSEGWLKSMGFLDLCRIGLAFTWPLALVAALALVAVIVLVLKRS